MHRVIKSIANIIKRTLQPFLDSFLGFTKCTTKCVDKYFNPITDGGGVQHPPTENQL